MLCVQELRTKRNASTSMKTFSVDVHAFTMSARVLDTVRPHSCIHVYARHICCVPSALTDQTLSSPRGHTLNYFCRNRVAIMLSRKGGGIIPVWCMTRALTTRPLDGMFLLRNNFSALCACPFTPSFLAGNTNDGNFVDQIRHAFTGRGPRQKCQNARGGVQELVARCLP